MLSILYDQYYLTILHILCKWWGEVVRGGDRPYCNPSTVLLQSSYSPTAVLPKYFQEDYSTTTAPQHYNAMLI